MRVQFKLKFILFAIISMFSVADNLQAAELTVLSPANNSYVESEKLNVVLSLPDGGATTIKIAAGGKIYEKKVRKPTGKDVVCLAVTLVNGLNLLEIAVSGSTGVVAESRLTVYLRSALSKPHQNPPAGFKRYYFHLPANEIFCAPCHRMEATLHDLTPENWADSPCFQCHKDKGEGTYKHKPVAAGACFSCHEVAKDKRKYDTKKPDQNNCFVCHSSQDKLWKSQKVHHGPTAVGNCTLCHNPHGSDWPSFVKMHPTDLCLNCHNDKKSGLHVIAGFFGKGHPVRGLSNPLKPDRPFSCAGCHNPHASETQSLLNRDHSGLEVYCQTCHKL